MKFIKHRINQLKDLELLPEGLGPELDLRAAKDSIYTHHDPSTDGDDLKGYLKLWRQKKARHFNT